MSPQDRIEQSTQLNLYKNCLSKSHNNALKGLKGFIKNVTRGIILYFIWKDHVYKHNTTVAPDTATNQTNNAYYSG